MTIEQARIKCSEEFLKRAEEETKPHVKTSWVDLSDSVLKGLMDDCPTMKEILKGY